MCIVIHMGSGAPAQLLPLVPYEAQSPSQAHDPPCSAQHAGSESQSQKLNADGAAVVGRPDGGGETVGAAEAVGARIVGTCDGAGVDGRSVGSPPTHLHHLL